ncbi:uncharacterized protein TERG_12534 [Trichophyton rubrum CBS 118892]|nr:uncharacterized protein TERG_12534 [Trichophyton rubrum CBS 118892]KFL62642.1 hypothetical protein TERG_12534 [Trichophyton rubrum CBS 118892]
MDILKSLRPLVLSLNPSSANTLVRLRERRAELSIQVTDLINTLGPEMFPDFDSSRVVSNPFKDTIFRENLPYSSLESLEENEIDEPLGDYGRPRIIHRSHTESSMQDQLPRNESFHDLASFGFFSTRPSSRSRSRSSSNGGLIGSSGFPLKEFSTLDSKESFEEVSKRIRGAMRERGRQRRRKSEDSNMWESSDSESQTAENRKDV